MWSICWRVQAGRFNEGQKTSLSGFWGWPTFCFQGSEDSGYGWVVTEAHQWWTPKWNDCWCQLVKSSRLQTCHPKQWHCLREKPWGKEGLRQPKCVFVLMLQFHQITLCSPKCRKSNLGGMMLIHTLAYFPIWNGKPISRSKSAWEWCYVASGRANSRVENLMVTMKSNFFVSHQTHLLSWMVLANLWVSFYQRSVRHPRTNHHCATMNLLSALMTILGPWKRFLVYIMLCNTFYYTFFVAHPIALVFQPTIPLHFHPAGPRAPKVDDVTFVPRMDEAKDGQSSCAKACPSVTWNSSWTSIVWHVRSTLQGLQPVRPVVVSTRVCEIGPSSLLMIEWFLS